MRSMRTMAALALVIALAACSEQSGTPTDIESLHPSFKNDGISGYSGAPGAQLCSHCHDPDNGAAPPTVTLSGPTNLGPGETQTYTLSIEPAAGSNQSQGGLNVAVPGGGTLIAGSGTSIDRGEIVHSQPRRGSGTLSWSFQWQAPSGGGTYTMYGVGLSTDGSNTRGDEQGTDQLSITVQAGNAPPSADPKQVNTDVNTAVTITLSGSDAETCELTFAILNDPSHGTLSAIADHGCSGGNDQAEVTYTPDADYTGSDQFTYSVTDGNGASAQATVDVNVTAAANSPPNADSKNVDTDVNTAVTITLSGSDAESCELTFEIVSGPSHGSLSAIANQGCSGGSDQADVTYTPDTDYTGSDQFTYSVTDGGGASAQATVDINVIGAGNSPPNADSKNIDTDVNTAVTITLSGSDAETCELTFEILNGPSHGSLSGIADQSCSGGGDQAEVTYTPDTDYTGSDQFTYSVTDENGASAQATVEINIVDPTVVDYTLQRVRARADKDLKLEAAFIIKNEGNRQQGPVQAELYVDDPEARNGGPKCTMQASDEPGRGSTAFWFAPSTGCNVPLTTKDAPADYLVTIRLVDRSPDSQTDVVHVRQVGKIKGVMSAIQRALRRGGSGG